MQEDNSEACPRSIAGGNRSEDIEAFMGES